MQQNKSLNPGCELYAAWERFVRLNKEDDAIPPGILRSWRRCKALNLDPFRRAGALAPQGIGERKRRKVKLLASARPYVSTLFRYMHPGRTFFLADETGVLLELQGEERELLFYHNVHLHEGAVWSEAEAGTNAVGTVIAEKQPLQIVGVEHYCAVLHGVACSACPIFGAQGQFEGVLGIAEDVENAHPFTLSVTVALAKAIENQLRNDKLREEGQRLADMLRCAADNMPGGIIGLDERGRIVKMNGEAEKLFKTGEWRVSGKPLVQAFPFLAHAARSAEYGLKEEVEAFNEPDEARERLTVSVLPFFNKRNLREGALLSIRKSEEKPPPDAVTAAGQSGLTGAEAGFDFSAIVGANRNFLREKQVAAAAAATNSTVLLLGESGTGKELFARAIHRASGRRGALICINCSAIPQTLIESELFGYEAGSFTGASRGGHMGKFERAGQGTIFLDEIGDMPLPLQATLLRVLQEKSIVRVGGHQPIPVDVRVIAATNRNLAKRVEEGAFREDLFFRLNVIAVNIPPLRERRDDIPLLVDYLLPKLGKGLGKRIGEVSAGAMKILKSYAWPGNVRELENVLERSLLLASGSRLAAGHLPKALLAPKRRSPEAPEAVFSLEEVERAAILRALRQKRNLAEAAAALGISRSTLYRKMKDLDAGDSAEESA